MLAAWALLFLTTYGDVCLGEVSVQSSTKLLRERLLKNYTTWVRPVRYHENTTVVTIALQPVHVVHMDEKQGILYMDTVADISWEDQTLHWDPQEYSGVERIILSARQIWTPDVRLFNSRSYRTSPWNLVDVAVDSKGVVSWSSPASMSLICEAFDYSLYPSDVQTCWLELGCWVESKAEIDYVIKEKEPSSYVFETTSPYWGIDSFNGSKFVYLDDDNEFQVVVLYQMGLRRIHVPHSYLGSVPETVARLLILCIFWLPGLTKKLCLGCLTLVLLTTVVLQVTQLLPSPAASPFALAEPTAALEMCMAAIILEMVVFFLPLLDVASPVILDRLSRVRALQVITSGTSKPLVEEDQEETSPENLKPKEGSSNRWAFLGTLIDRAAFVVFAVLLLAV